MSMGAVVGHQSAFEAVAVTVPGVHLGQVALLTGGEDRHYAVGLAIALADEGLQVEVIGSDEVDCAELHSHPRVTFLNLRGDRTREAALPQKIARLLRYYARLVRYAATSPVSTFHILWNNKWQLFDRTLLTLYYRLCHKRVVMTVHNVNAARRDGRDSRRNRLSLRIQYRLCDHLFVHTELMKAELIQQFDVDSRRITVIPYGINNAVPHTPLTSAQARECLGLAPQHKVVLFFGNIAPYKGLEYLVEAAQQLLTVDPDYRLLIAGRPKKHGDDYWRSIRRTIESAGAPGTVLQRIEHIPDEDAEVYFKAADVLALPYTDIFQSGILFFGYSFGLPVIATNVGSLADEVLQGVTGFICRPRDAADLRDTIERYFSSDLHRQLPLARTRIRAFAEQRHSWATVARLTRDGYGGE